MGCGCKKSKAVTSVASQSNSSRVAVYQVTTGNGKVLSEHSTSMEARKAAADSGGRVRITSRSSQPAANAVN